MKQKYFIAALMAGMLALAGCGGGNSSSDMVDDGGDGLTPEQIAAIKEACSGDGLAYDDTTQRCKVDTDEADAAARNADYLALFKALDGPVLGDATATQASFIDSNTSDGTVELYDLDNAEDQDDHKSASVSGQGAKFSSLNNSEADITRVADNHRRLELAEMVVKDNVEFSGASAGAPETHSKTATYDADGDAETQPVIAFAASGKYRGVDGMYYCTGDDACSSLVNNAGMLVLAGDWYFEPGNTDAQLKVANAVTYGWWTDTPAGGSLGAGLFSNREREDHINATYPGTLGGSATYKGDALGQYVMSADSFGGFTATATLTASFTGTNTLEGMIGGFKDADGGDLAGWEVKLSKTNLDVDGTFVDPIPAGQAQAGWNIGDAKGEDGDWQAALYGGSATAYPDYAAGEFSAQHGPTGRMIGAFGASLQEE